MLKKIADVSLMLVFSIVSLSCGKDGGGGNTPPAVVPGVRVEDASLTRTTTDGTMHFTVSLDKTTTVPVSVNYALADGSAKSPKDYTSATGTITIPANQFSSEFTVQIKGDPTDTRQDNLDFTVQLSNPKSCTIGVGSAKGTIITENGMNFTTDNTGFTTLNTYPGKTLVWADEFNGNTLNTSDWNYEIGNGSGGWGNNELEY